MDSRRFQEAIRALAAEATRRGVLRRLAGGGASVAGLALGQRQAGAAKGDCGPCKSRPLGSTRCQYDCTPRECYVCDANANKCVCRQPLPDTLDCQQTPCAQPPV